MNAITLKQLKKTVDTFVKAGYGDKQILIAEDDEGNYFRKMYCDITDANIFSEEDMRGICDLSQDEKLKDFVILG